MSTTKDMEPEQITNTEDLNTPTTPKVKNPKKVKAGKALAKINAEARKLIKQDEEISTQEESSTPIGVSKIYNGILSMAGLVGAGFTLYHGWKFFETSHYNPLTKVEKLPSITPKKSLRKTIDF